MLWAGVYLPRAAFIRNRGTAKGAAQAPRFDMSGRGVSEAGAMSGPRRPQTHGLANSTAINRLVIVD